MLVNDKEVKLANGTLRKVEDEFGHSYYEKEHGYSVGVTTILSETLPTPYGLKQWYQTEDKYTIEKVFKEAQEQGTTTHQFIDLLNQANEVDLSEESNTTKMQVTAYADWVRNWRPDELQSEQVIFYKDDNLQYAGTVDIVCMINGQRVLIDIKTSNQVGISAFLQVEAYAKAYELSYGKKIDKTLILQLGTSHRTLNTKKPIMDLPSNGINWKVHEHNKTFDDWKLTYDMWQMLNDHVYPEPPKVVEYAERLKLFDLGQLDETWRNQLEQGGK